MSDTGHAHATDRALTAIVRDCLEGSISPDTALMRLMIETAQPKVAVQALCGLARGVAPSSAAKARLTALAVLLEGHTDVWRTVHATSAAAIHETAECGSPGVEIARVAKAFDRAARISPEASVALYSFGRSDRLDRATTEVAAWLDRRGVTGADRTLLDIGCGIGRLERALHDRAARIVGIDISREMVRIARGRCAGLANVEIRRTSGLGLDGFAEASFDAVIALDTFPYLVAAGDSVAARHVSDAARLLRPGGSLVILNFSYRGSQARDRADVRRLAELCGLRMLIDGDHPFTRWDGAAFHMRRER